MGANYHTEARIVNQNGIEISNRKQILLQICSPSFFYLQLKYGDRIISVLSGIQKNYRNLSNGGQYLTDSVRSDGEFTETGLIARHSEDLV